MKKLLFAVITIITTMMYAGSARAALDIYDSNEKSLVMEQATIVKDYNNKDALLIVYTYTNKTNTPHMPITEFYFTAFQNGVSLQDTYTFVNDYSSLTSAGMTQVKDGGSVAFASLYLLRDTTTTVEVEVKADLLGKSKGSFTITLNAPTETSEQPATDPVPTTEPIEPAPEPVGEVDWEAEYNALLEKYNALLADLAALSDKYE